MNQQAIAWKHTCERCGHEWTTVKELPQNCSGCNSPYWNRPRSRPTPADSN